MPQLFSDHTPAKTRDLLEQASAKTGDLLEQASAKTGDLLDQTLSRTRHLPGPDTFQDQASVQTDGNLTAHLK